MADSIIVSWPKSLASLQRSRARYADAEPLYQRALAILQKALGSDRRRTAPGWGSFLKFHAGGMSLGVV
jgi:hypothetical protein